MRSRSFIITVFITLAVVCAVLWRTILFASATTGEALYFLDVGQGDSELVELKGGVHMLIDGGPSGKALLQNLSEILPPQKKYIDLVLMTHPQLDHFGGFIDVLKNYEVGAFIWTGRTGDSAAYKELDQALTAHNVRRVQVKEGDTITYGDAVFSVLGPSAQDVTSKELNDTGIVLFLKTPEVKALYTADIDDHTEIELAQKYDVDIDVLKVAHHGSRFSSDAGFLKEASPQFSVIGVGKNTYGHPTAQTLSRLKDVRTQIFRTDQDGIVKIVFEDGKLVRK